MSASGPCLFFKRFLLFLVHHSFLCALRISSAPLREMFFADLPFTQRRKKVLKAQRKLLLPVIRTLFHIRIRTLHPALWAMHLNKAKTLVQSMRVLRRQDPAAE